MAQCILISGCSGGGKSTLLAELKQRGHSTIEEPGRRIVAEEKAGTGAALPWVDMEAFAHRAIAVARSDLVKAESEPGLVFFDRSLIDAAVALQSATGVPLRETVGEKMHYAKTVFLAPPWTEIFAQDEDRRHGLNAAIEEFERLEFALQDLGYLTCLLPKASVRARADFMLDRIENW
jgi:predicted ATPase